LRGGGEGAETGMEERGRVGVGEIAKEVVRVGRGGLGGEFVSAHCVDG